MIATPVQTITALEAEAVASLFLCDCLPDRFCTGQPRLDESAKLWRVPVLLSYPFIGPVGELGEVTVSLYEEKIVSHTPVDEMKARGLQIYEQRRDAIEAAFLQTRNA